MPSSDSLAVPQHIAIVMDGNGRWANKRYMPRLLGHRQGVSALKRCVRACAERGVGALSVFAFSSENWNRPADEVSALLALLMLVVSKEVPQLHAQGVLVDFVGDCSGLSEKMRNALLAAEQLTQANSKLVLNVCFNYGGRWDIAQAAAALAQQGKPITESSLNAAMALSHVPDPDLLIRTGGEQRISNFLLWQSAYTELYFTDTLWPDFDEASLDAALLDYAGRERRFGKTSAQLQNKDKAPC